MKGDFSKGAALTGVNDLGLLYQQGRVISDADLTAGEVIAQEWRETAARDVIGAHVAAVPAGDPDGYFVEAAQVHSGHVDVRLRAGRIWADGVHLALPETTTWGASYLGAALVGEITDGTRDAVVLEVELGALNGFQDPTRLIEPALGGPDTAERIHPHQSLKLLRMTGGENCTTIGPRLRDNLAAHGRLSVTLEPATVVAGDCPVVEGGGYSGFEHNLYRIEIAQTNAAAPIFKWSSMNGGLVGRGRLISDGGLRIEITANRGAIIHAGFTEYYLETLIFDDHLGRWRINYGTTARLNAQQDAIVLDAPATFGAAPGDGDRIFFRLWNGIAPRSEFAAGPTLLRDGVELHFTSPAGQYVAEDYWTFDLRAGEITNPETLHDNAPPMGPVRRRVPLAEITWTARGNTDISGTIEDCRKRFRPLSNQKICCTYLVGNGQTTFGDFNSLEEAAAHLPAQGGKLCLLPGIHFANLELSNRRNIIIEGCRRRTMVLPRIKTFAQPIIRVTGGSEIEIAHLDFFAPFGIAIDAAGRSDDALEGLRINGCRVLSLTYGFRVEWAHKAQITDNQIWLLDHMNALSAISLRATDSRVEMNTLGVWPFEFKPPLPGDPGDDTPPDPADPCIEPEDLYGNITLVVGYVLNAWLTILTMPPVQPYRARGGLHLRGGCERVSAIRNRIDGGAGHGITLGGLYLPEAEGDPATEVETAAPFPVTISPNTKGFIGFARLEDGTPVNGLVLTLAKIGDTDGDVTMTAPPDGRFRFPTPPGSYQLSAAAGYAILKVDQGDGEALVIVRKISAPVRPDAAFLYQIKLIDNTVERMALSGIGFLFHSLKPIAPVLPSAITAEAFAEFVSDLASPRELIGTTNLVRDLVIRGNRLQDNLRVVFTDAMRAIASVVGMGGVSLAIVEGLRIEGNHIVRNGLSASTPSNGIFVGYCEDAIIAGNHIAENGPLDASYGSDAVGGLRGGITIRMASAIVAGGERDSQQKAAVDIRDNHIDQPAGRAVTVLAYGPVTCVGNHFNAERDGRGSFMDRLVGVVMILNLGGLHRHFNTGGFDSFAPREQGGNTGVIGVTAGLNVDPRAEALMPGGETLFNSNRLRMGGANQAYFSQLLLTLDDLGYDGNQSSVFSPDLHFSNLVALGQSVRISDNRFRERAVRTAASVISFAFGMNTSAKRHTLNMTTHNQADHCILALSNAGSVGKPVVDAPNQIVFDSFCPALGSPENKEKQAYLAASVAYLLANNQQFPSDLSAQTPAAEAAVSGSLEGLSDYQTGLLASKAGEAERLEQRYGTADMRVHLARQDMGTRAELADIMRDQAKVSRTKEVDEPTEGLVLDGRILDGNKRAYEGAIVELVDRNGDSLNIRAKADAAGYYALPINADELKNLQRRGDVNLQVVSEDGLTQTLDAKTLLNSDAGKVRTNIAFDIKRGHGLTGVAPVFATGGQGVFDGTRETTPRSPTAPVTPPVTPPVRPPVVPTPPVVPPVKPDPRPDPTPEPEPKPEPKPDPERDPPREKVVPLEDVTGVGPRLAERLNKVGITSANDLAVADKEALQEAVGARGTTLRDNAVVLMRKQTRRTQGDG